ncbi:MAG: dTMP kinase [Planctomycetes bacterium]|nr:dTMP kinase [Planctomycetota bacterium]
MKQGRLLVIEGPDGGGKSTQAKLLNNALAAAGYEPVLAREPGGTRLGEEVRKILLNPEQGEIGPCAENFLFMACRAQLVDEVIAPALAAGRVVICDRFLLSTLVYQGIAGGLQLDEIRASAAMATRGLVPDLTLVLDVPAEIGLDRVGNTPDRMEQKGLEFHARIRQGYLDLAKEDPTAVVIDSTREIEVVAKEILAAVMQVLED